MTCLHRFGRTRDAAWRVETSKMGVAPVLDDAEKRLTQSGAILTCLAIAPKW
jgi:glutathione S-transferase